MGKDTKTKTEKDSHKKSSKKVSKKSEETVKVDKKSHKKESKDSKVSKDSSPKKPSSDKQSKPSKKENTLQSKPKKPTKESNDDEEPLHEIQKKPGQKHAEPSLDDPTRAFYETLFEQNPSSQMAQKYCLEYGLLPEDMALTLISKLRNKK